MHNKKPTNLLKEQKHKTFNRNEGGLLQALHLQEDISLGERLASDSEAESIEGVARSNSIKTRT